MSKLLVPTSSPASFDQYMIRHSDRDLLTIDKIPGYNGHEVHQWDEDLGKSDLSLKTIRDRTPKECHSEEADSRQRETSDRDVACSCGASLGLVVSCLVVSFGISDENIVSYDRECVPQGDNEDKADYEVDDLLGVVSVPTYSDDVVYVCRSADFMGSHSRQPRQGDSLRSVF